MSGSGVVQVHFGGEHGDPVGVSRKPKRTGRRVLVRVDDFESSSLSVFILHHAEIPDLILAASTQRQTVERALARIDSATGAYKITSVPVLDGLG